jgi:hypothetical protein
MNSIAALYNTLPSLDQANKKFSNREHIFPMLAAVLTGYEDKFAINLVHRHSILKEGEKMVTIGNITEPMKDVECYPDRWLATGQAYVFNTKPTESPPEDLLEKFKAVVDTVGYIGGVGVLGLGCLKNLPEAGQGQTCTEITEGRADIVKHVPANQKGMIWTSWKSVDGCMKACSSCTKDQTSLHHIHIGYAQDVHDPHHGDHGPHHGDQGPSH